MRLNLLGLPGTGTARLARELSQSAGLMLLNVDQQAADDAISGEAPLATITRELADTAARDGFVLQGFPQSLPQAQTLDRALAMIGQPFHLAVIVRLETGILRQRVRSSRQCSQCGELSTAYTDGAPGKPACLDCGAELTEGSQDDGPDDEDLLAAAERHLSRLAKYYRTQNRLLNVDITGEHQADLDCIKNALQTRMRHHQI
mgnify:FL=1